LVDRVQGNFYGFDHIEVAADHGDQASGDYLLWTRKQVPDLDASIGPENALPKNRITVTQAWRIAAPEEFFIPPLGSRIVPIKTPRSFCKCFPDLYHPFTPPGRYWDIYNPTNISLSESFGQGVCPRSKL